MTPYYADPSLAVHIGDCRAVMAEMEPESVHCVVTSPPYWGLRDYGVAGQLGLEPTPEAYVAAMVDVFREVRRVLRDDGTVWLNLGDSYAGSGMTGGTASKDGGAARVARMFHGNRRDTVPGLAQKQLIGIPWHVAFALQADGWYLRSDIIWAKPNPMPESVTDRPTKAHEYLFLLSKAPRYYFDSDAVREPSNGQSAHDLTGPGYAAPGQAPQSGNRRLLGDKGVAAATEVRASAGARMGRGAGWRDDPSASRGGRNLRSVWTIATQPYPGAHFATFPEKLVEPCVKAGTSERGACPECGALWVRVVERTIPSTWEERKAAGARGGNGLEAARETGARHQVPARGSGVSSTFLGTGNETTGWRPSCDHKHLVNFDSSGHTLFEPEKPVPATILDPFAGSGTVGRVANRLGRRAILIDLSADYIDQAMVRNAQAGLGLGA